MDALAMEFADNSFDFVWACESGEHMPDKKAYVEEMARVLAPGGQVSNRGRGWGLTALVWQVNTHKGPNRSTLVGAQHCRTA